MKMSRFSFFTPSFPDEKKITPASFPKENKYKTYTVLNYAARFRRGGKYSKSELFEKEIHLFFYSFLYLWFLPI